MNPLYHIFGKRSTPRDLAVQTASLTNIAANFCLAGMKIALGLISSSAAIMSEAVNNAADAVSSVLTIVGAKLSRRKPDKKHPFGYGRIEYLTGLLIAAMITYSGVKVCLASLKKVFLPVLVDISYLSLGAIAFSALVKFALGVYLIRMGKRTDCAPLRAVGLECRDDFFASVMTVASALVFRLFHVQTDAYAGLLTSLAIVRTGICSFASVLPDLLGRPGDEQLSDGLYREIRQTEGIVRAAGMTLHNYGPGTYFGSVTVEMSRGLSVEAASAILCRLRENVARIFHVSMVFDVYPAEDDGGGECIADKEFRGKG
ncbi:MAG: cation diffusion facilitator family transporter [Clostridia bacterium]|nr:cation diffusion facilitator family transporter [Clostridia bacterium]